VAAATFETAPAEFKSFLDRLLGNLGGGSKSAGGGQKQEPKFEEKPSR
jgi:hypothetical protein